MNKLRALLAAAAITTGLALTAPAPATAAPPAPTPPCNNLLVGNSASSTRVTWFSDWNGYWDFVHPGVMWYGHQGRKVRVELGHKVYVGRSGQGFNQVRFEAGWWQPSGWSCAGGTYIAKQVPL